MSVEERLAALEDRLVEVEGNITDLFSAITERYERNREERVEREMFPAVCHKCGVQCTVPFQPEEGRGVYCRKCFHEKTSSGTAR